MTGETCICMYIHAYAHTLITMPTMASAAIVQPMSEDKVRSILYKYTECRFLTAYYKNIRHVYIESNNIMATRAI